MQHRRAGGIPLYDYLPSVAAFAVFGLLHSVGAREPCKRWLGTLLGEFFVVHFWRAVYCVLSGAALYWWISGLHWLRHPEHDVWLVRYPDWLWTGITLLHLASVGLMYVAFIQSDYLEFLGFKQMWRGILAWLGRLQPALTLFGTHRLVTDGIYGWVRHPMLSAGLLFLLTSGPSLNNLVYTAMYAGYMVVGAYYEERRLVRLFGDAYLRYRREVGAFVPHVWRFRLV